ncbi:MAG: DegT/DnrJ/EryC1/StrS family aminotransferase [Thermoplasmata archaeon]|nr:MAG: DegT/DnrJ/EryC1/StrS family aminotransferase [Thermoplasmata archaeon]
MVKNHRNIPLARPYFPPDTIESVRKVLDSGWVTQGPMVREFEEKFAKFIGCKHAIAVSSGTAALHISLQALGIEKNDEVIIPDFTFAATGSTVLFMGAKPVLADIDLRTYCIDLEEARRRITQKTKAMVPVHCFGHPAPMEVVMEIAEENDLIVIEDAAPAHGAECNGKKVGNFGGTGCFSFHPRKIISTGEGGMITTSDDDVAEKARLIRNHGMSSIKYDDDNEFHLPTFELLGYNYRMSDILAAIGVKQLGILDRAIKERRRLAGFYNDLISDYGMDIVIPEEHGNVKHVYQSYVILFGKEKIRTAVLKALRSRGIGCTIGTFSLSNLPIYDGSCPNGTKAFNGTLALPMYEGLENEDVEYVVECLKENYQE